MLSLPIPQAAKEIRIAVKYYPLSLWAQHKEFIFSVSEFATLSEIK